MNVPNITPHFTSHSTFLKRVYSITFSSLIAFAAALALPAQAQFRVDVSGVGLTQVPISIVSFKSEELATQKISAIVMADLARSGRFRAVDAGAVGMDENSRPDMSSFRQKGADAMAVGSVSRLADGRLDVRFRLWDVVKATDIGAESHVVTSANSRLAAHRISDYIYEKLTGEKGIFSTRIAYITKAGTRHTMWIADSDGENAKSALASPEPIISPSWSPNGTQLTYVSFESRKPEVWTHEVLTGKRRLLATFRGSNSAPSWSPDGRNLVVTLTRDGNAQVYTLPANGGEPKRLTRSDGIETEARYSADGMSIYFVSDRGGSPQIYRMGAGGGTGERITFSGSYNISPSLSPDGRWLAYISRIGGAFKLHVMELSTGAVTALTDTAADEHPSFAANSKLIVYATKLQGKEALMTTTLDGRIKATLAGVGGDIREPAWGPFEK